MVVEEESLISINSSVEDVFISFADSLLKIVDDFSLQRKVVVRLFETIASSILDLHSFADNRLSVILILKKNILRLN